jgi:hypothetical protein
MAIRNTNYGGATNWTSEVLTSTDLNDTFDSSYNKDVLRKYGDRLGGIKNVTTTTIETSVLDVSYTSISISTSQTWTVKSGSIIRVDGTLKIEGNISVSTSIAGGSGNITTTHASGGNGGSAGGLVAIFAKSIFAGTGALIYADGTAGQAGQSSYGTITGAGNDGTAGSGFSIFGLTETGSGGGSGKGGNYSSGAGPGSNPGGAGGTSYKYSLALLTQYLRLPYKNITLASGGGGGSSAGNNGDANIYSGGGTGGGGGSIFSDGTSGSGQGGHPSQGTKANGGGGGGGGTGGVIILQSEGVTNPTNLTLRCYGGAGGAGGAGNGGDAGYGGGAGSGGLIVLQGTNVSTVNVTTNGGITVVSELSYLVD